MEKEDKRKFLIIEIISEGESTRVDYKSKNLTPFEKIGLLQYYKELEQTNLFIENSKKNKLIK